MINEYANISVIWGGEFGQKYSLRIQRIINGLHQNEGYPVRCRVQNSFVPSSNILCDVKELFHECDYVIMLLSATDEGRCIGDTGVSLKKRLRQNVLLELGMAIALVGEDRLACLTDFDPDELGDIELPSDLKPLFVNNIKDKKDSELKKILLDIFIQKLGLSSCKQLYSNAKYMIDYKDLFTYKSGDILKQGMWDGLDLFQYWRNASKSFDWNCERCVFLFERIKFLSIFSRKKETIQFLNSWKDELLSMPAAIRHDKDKYDDFDIWMKNLLRVCWEYIVLRLDQERRRDAGEYITCEQKLENCKYEYENTIKKDVSRNPLFGVILYEYYGLALLHRYEKIMSMERLDQIISVFEIGYTFAKKLETTANMWMGFFEFDLARVYEKRFALDKSREWFDKTNRMLVRCVETRKQWPKLFLLHDSLRNALSYEYLKAELAYIKFHKENLDYSHESLASTRAKAVRLTEYITELEVTYERIHDVKREIERYLDDDEVRISEI